RQCPLLAQSGHHDTLIQCPLLGVKRTLFGSINPFIGTNSPAPPNCIGSDNHSYRSQAVSTSSLSGNDYVRPSGYEPVGKRAQAIDEVGYRYLPLVCLPRSGSPLRPVKREES